MTTTETSTDIITIRGQRFAQFGKYLADVTPFDYTTPRGDLITCAPEADQDGNYNAEFPDEGRSSMVCRFVNHTRNDTHIGSGPFRWIFTAEAGNTRQQIADHTAEMLDDGILTSR